MPTEINENSSLDALFQTWKKTGKREVRDMMLNKLEPTINSAVKSYGGGDKQLNTQAKILAIKAINNYQPGRSKLSTYIHSSLRPLSRIRDKRKSAIYLPENVRVDSQTVYRFKDNFRNTEGREPSLQEISDNVGLSIKRINKALQEGSERSSSELETEKGEVILSNADKDRNYANIWQDYIYHDLEPVNQKIMEWTTGYGGLRSRRKVI